MRAPGSHGWLLVGGSRYRANLVLYALLVLVAPLLAAILLVHQTTDTARGEGLRQAESTARAMAIGTDEYLGRSLKVLNAVAQQPELWAEEAAETELALRQPLVQQDGLRWVAVTRTDGIVRVSSTRLPDLTLPENVSNEPWFKAVLYNGQPVVSGRVGGGASDAEQVVLALPIAGERGHIVQVLIASVSLEPVRETLGVLARDRQMAYLLTDGNGLPLARDGWPVSVAEAGFAGLPSLRAALTRRAGHLEYRDQLDGTDWLAGYAPVARSRWTMTVAAPAGAVVGTAADGHVSQTLALAAAMLTALAAAIIISGRLAARVQALASSAQAAADDESTTPAPAGDELQQLARAIANLSSNLAVSRRNQHTQAAQLQHLVRRVADAQEEERRRIAVDLHDGASQLVVAAQYEAFACKRALDDGRPEVAARRLAQTQQLLTEALGELHRVVFDLRPKVLEELGLQGALEHHLGYLNESSDTTWTLETIGAPIVLPSETELAIYRIVQEALNNARRHARAREVHVTLRLTPQTGTFGALVEDDGCGFEPAIPLHDPHQHLGLRAMRDRAAQVGGTLQLETRQGGGMRVSLSVPTQWPMASSDPAPLHGVGGLAWRPDVAAT